MSNKNLCLDNWAKIWKAKVTKLIGTVYKRVHVNISTSWNWLCHHWITCSFWTTRVLVFKEGWSRITINLKFGLNYKFWKSFCLCFRTCVGANLSYVIIVICLYENKHSKSHFHMKRLTLKILAWFSEGLTLLALTPTVKNTIISWYSASEWFWHAQKCTVSLIVPKSAKISGQCHIYQFLSYLSPPIPPQPPNLQY